MNKMMFHFLNNVANKIADESAGVSAVKARNMAMEARRATEQANQIFVDVAWSVDMTIFFIVRLYLVLTLLSVIALIISIVREACEKKPKIKSLCQWLIVIIVLFFVYFFTAKL